MIMTITRFKPCCKQTAIEAFEHGIFYLIGCESCGKCFSITDNLDLFIDQIIAFTKIGRGHCLTFDVVVSNGNAVFLLP